MLQFIELVFYLQFFWMDLGEFIRIMERKTAGKQRICDRTRCDNLWCRRNFDLFNFLYSSTQSDFSVFWRNGSYYAAGISDFCCDGVGFSHKLVGLQ